MTDRIIGSSALRLDAVGKVTGETLYPGDLVKDGMLHMKILFSDRPHARIRSMDIAEAEALPGVVAIFTAKDVPVNEYGLIMPDQPVLCGLGSDKADSDIVRATMDQIALIVADDEAIATKARDLIRVDYEDLPAVFDAHEAMKDGAPQLHADSPGNVITKYQIRKGDMESGWASADVIVEGTYHTTWQEHAYLQPEAGLAYIDEEGRVTVEVAGQWTHEDLKQIAHALGLPPEEVRVIYPAIGGAFGGREDLSIQIVLGLAAMKLQRPVKIVWSREESMVGHHKRHPIIIEAKWGATKDGVITVVESTVIGDSGAYAYTSTKVMGNANLMVTGPYHIPNAHIDTYAVYTNNIPCGAFRGFGGPQAAFAAEGQMNKLADLLDMDPVEIRMKNVLRDGTPLTVQTPLPSPVTMDRVIAAAAEGAGWSQNDRGWQPPDILQPDDNTRKRGIGMGCAFKNVGFSFGYPEVCEATVELRGGSEIEEVIVKHAGADMGQGAHTAFAQMAAEAAGVRVDQVTMITSDTATSGNSGSASASRLTFMAGNSIRGAVDAAMQRWQDEDRPAVAHYAYHPPRTTMYDKHTGEAMPSFAYGYIAEVVEIEVDIETGAIDVIRAVVADDVGKAINPQLIRGQIEGAVVQAHGYTVMEDFRMKDGRVLTPFLNNYLIPTVLDVPREVKSLILEFADSEGPWGARGMAEMPILPFAPAVTAALYDATGVWIDAIPLTPERVVTALREAGIGG